MPVTALNLQVDSATFVNWSKALTHLATTFSIPLRIVQPIPGLNTPPSSITFTGLELLNRVGLACTRPHIHHDPERLFALLRYATRIRNTGTNTRLHQDLKDFDHHKKRVLSDELGAGFSFLVAHRLLAAQKFLDLREAIARKLVKTKAAKSRQPDYIATAAKFNSELIVLEAKGTQTRNHARRQINSGCKQVSAVKIIGSPSLTRIVVGTELQREDQKHDSRILVGDPEENGAFDYRFHGDPFVVIELVHLSKLAYTAGDLQLAALIDPYRDNEESAPAPLVHHNIGTRTFWGSVLEFRYGTSRAGFFLGLDENVRAAIAERSEHRLPPLQPSLAIEPRREPEKAPHFVSEDGLALEVWSEGPQANQNE